MGIDYETLRHKHPKLIYGHLSAWGRAGPMKNDPGYDFGAFWAHTGVMDIIRINDRAYKIQGEPILDQHNLVMKVEAHEIESSTTG